MTNDDFYIIRDRDFCLKIIGLTFKTFWYAIESVILFRMHVCRYFDSLKTSSSSFVLILIKTRGYKSCMLQLNQRTTVMSHVFGVE